MARNTTHKKKKVSSDPSFRKKKPLGYFPVVRKMEVRFQGGVGAVQFANGDAGSMLSRVNNRLYRYGKMYDLKFDVSAALPAGTTIEIYALSNTWYVQKAFEEAKHVYDRAYENEMENVNETNIARWRDFRIRPASAIPSYNIAGSWAYPTVYNSNYGATPITTGDFPDSLVEDSSGTTRFFTWDIGVGTNYGVVQEYDLAGNQTRNPNLGTGTMPYADLEADSSAVEGAALQIQGQDPPYGATDFPNWWVKVGELTVGGQGQTKLSTGFFHAPCGQFKIRTATTDEFAAIGDNLTLEVRAGDYKGVHAVNMERM